MLDLTTLGGASESTDCGDVRECNYSRCNRAPLATNIGVCPKVHLMGPLASAIRHGHDYLEKST